MDVFDWRSFLAQWSAEVFSSKDLDDVLDPKVIAAGYLGYPGATAEQIAHLETRLGATLPPSYRAFLQASNGWHLANEATDKLWSTEEIEWFAVRHQDWIDSWMRDADAPDLLVSDEEYFDYTRYDGTMRSEYLQTALEISSNYPDDEGIYLLNPQIVTPTGEWEAWHFASDIPGAIRFPSFQDMMQRLYEGFTRRRARGW